MSDIFVELTGWGCDIPGAMRRFLNDEGFYINCLKTVVSDVNFDALGPALAAGESEKAFDCAHTLKGIIGNMGLTPIYDIVVKIVEPLRAGICTGLDGYYKELLEARAYLKSLIEKS